MKAVTRKIEETTVLHVENHLYSKQDRDRLHRELQKRIETEGSGRLVVDFSKARWIGAPILGELILAAQQLHEQGGELLLVGSPKIDRIIKTARADRVKLFANVQSALASFGRPVCAAA